MIQPVPPPDSLDDELDGVYGAPLDEFVRARNELAKRLKKEGHAAEAEEVRRLAKPSVAAWAVNQLAHRRARDLRALLDAAARLRDVQATGRGDFAQAAAAERAAVTKLVGAAAEILSETGRRPTDATLGRVATTLHAAAASESARADLERGRLTEELEPAGFGALLGAMPESPPTREDEVGRARERRSARNALAELRTRADEAGTRLREAERAVASAREELDRAEAEAARVRSEAEDAAAAVADAEKRLRDLG
jgi:hypothetical protein